jgi:hypothetical protein
MVGADAADVGDEGRRDPEAAGAFKIVPPVKLDGGWFVLAVESIRPAVDPMEILRMARAGEVGLLKLDPGYALLRVQEWPSGHKELNVFGLAGRDVIRQFPKIWPVIMAEAKRLECQFLGGLVQRKGLIRAYTKMGMRIYGMHMLMKVE